MGKKQESLRVFVDTNILFSAIAFPGSTARRVVERIFETGTLVISSYSIDEMRTVFARKLPSKLEAWEEFLKTAPLELVRTPSNPKEQELPFIRDEKDIPILASVLTSQPDCFVTGDRDFHTDEIKKRIKVITPGEFLVEFGD